jgi:hypothetical protein
MIDELTRKGLLDYIKPRFKLRWDGAHGISHWRRVESNGLLLCEKTKANPRVIALFSLLHDACRDNEYEDPDHGKRERVTKPNPDARQIRPAIPASGYGGPSLNRPLQSQSTQPV